MTKIKTHAIFTLALTSLLLFVFAACSQTDSTGSVILSATVPRASFDVDSDAALTTDEKTFTLEVSLTGGYKETQSQTVSLEDNSKTFEFQEVPADTLLKVTAKLLQGTETLYTGESERFIVKPGENLVKISMKKGDGEETIWVVLWNRAEKELGSSTENLVGGMSAFTLASLSAETALDTTALSQSRVDSFCFDENGNLYTLEYASPNYALYKYPKTASGFDSENVGYISTLNSLMTGINAGDKTVSEIKCSGDYLYLMWNSNNYSSPSTTIATLPLSAFDDETSATLTDFSVSAINANFFDIADGYLYLGNRKYICKFDLNSDSFTFDANTACDIQPTNLGIADTYYTEVNAIKVIDGYIFGLYSYKEMDKTTKGGVFKIDISTMSLQNWSNGNKLFGWNYTEIPTPNASEKYFFNPTKFIATVPKKLVISDDGLRYPVDNDTDPQNQNRVVTIDLETESMSATNVGVMFDYQKTGCGCTLAN